MIFENEKTFMPLKPCRECKKKVSTEAAACPSCGAPRPTLSSAPKNQDIISDGLRKVSAGIESFKKGMADEPGVYNQTSEASTVAEKELMPVFWVFFVGGNLVLKVPFFFVESSWAVNFWLVIWFIYNLFVILVVFDAADKYKKEKIKKGLGYGWATTAKVASVLVFLSAIGNML